MSSTASGIQQNRFLLQGERLISIPVSLMVQTDREMRPHESGMFMDPHLLPFPHPLYSRWTRMEMDPVMCRPSAGTYVHDRKIYSFIFVQPQGTLLATGYLSGQARIWTEKGELKHILAKHQNPIFSLKWNRAGTILLTGGVDQLTIAWDPFNGEAQQTFAHHSGEWKRRCT